MNGHVQLGATTDDLRDYLLVDPTRWQKNLSNPFAAKLATGAGKYDDLENWAAWVMDGWQGGIGRIDAADGGMLYADCDSRVPGQLILPLMPATGTDYTDANQAHSTGDGMCLPRTDQAEDLASSIDVPSGNQTKLAWKTAPRTAWIVRNIDVAVLMWCPVSSTITLELYSDNSGAPGTLVQAFNRVTVGRGGWGWQTFNYAPVDLPVSTYWLVLSHTGGSAVKVAALPSHTGSETKRGSGWATSVSAAPIYAMMSGPDCYSFAEFNGTIYSTGNGDLQKWDATDGRWETAASGITTTIRQHTLEVFADKLYIGSPTGSYYTCSTADVITTVATDGEYFKRAGGYLWKWYDNQLSYSADGSTWEPDIAVGDSTETITTLAALRDEVYVATDLALYLVAAGDLIVGITRVPGGVDHMVEHNGSLYLVADDGQSLVLFDGSGVQSIWRMEHVPEERLPRLRTLCSTNSWLVALCSDDATYYGAAAGSAKLLVWQTEGWHVLASLPMQGGVGLLYSFGNRSIWCGGSGTAMLPITDISRNTYYDSSRYFPFGWLESSWFDGDLLDVEKDWESAFVVGSFSAAQTCSVYYRTDEAQEWSLLGVITDSEQELRWTTRPTGRRIQIALALATTNTGATPRVQAVRLKYMPMVRDRWRWQLPIGVHERQQMLDGSINVQTAAEMMTHLDALTMQTAPVRFVDVDGTAYECKVLAGGANIQRFEYIDGAARAQFVVSLTLEQVA
jgi:hypothetical protein